MSDNTIPHDTKEANAVETNDHTPDQQSPVVNQANTSGNMPQQGYNHNYYSGSGNYNNYNGNKSYNKHYNNSGNASGNNRQNYNNNANRQHYNNRKNYNNPKMGHHNNQYNNYNQYPANMYSYGYYPSPYGYPAPMVAGISPIPGYPQPFGAIPTGGKIKITDKEGKQIDLEEKKKTSNATNSPINSPVSSSVSPAKSFTPLASGASVEEKPSSKESTYASSPKEAPAATAAPAKLSVAEEFKRKILERAAKAAQEKEDEKKKAAEAKAAEVAKAAESKAAEDAKLAEEARVVAETKAAEAKAVEAKVAAIKAAETKAAEEKVAETKAAETKAAEEKAAEEKAAEEKAVEIKAAEDKAVEDKAAEDKAVEDKAAEEKAVEDKAAEEAVTTEESKSEAPKSEESKEVESTETTSEPVVDEAVSKTEDNEETPEEEPKEEEPKFDLSQFFDRLKIVDEIEDPYSVTYPEPFVGVDSSRKLDFKKYRYDPQFLMQFRDVVQYHVGTEWKNKLESLGIVANIKKSGPQSARGGKFGGSMSGRFNGPLGNRGQFNEGRQNSRSGSKRRGGGSSRDKSTRKGNQSKRGNRDKEADAKPLEDVKPLEKSANRWVPRSKAAKKEVRLAPDGTEILEEEDIERKVKSLLNKLTLEMFDTISEEILKIASQSKWEDDAKTVRQIISLTFAKACDEPYWSSMYAQFCAKMCTSISDEVKDVSIILKSTGQPATGGDLARRILLTTCQTEYEKGWTDKLPTNEDGTPLEPEMMSDEYYIMAAAKRRGLGLVKFIGHLYILGMLNDQVILLCLRDQSKNTEDPSEDSLENLAQLVNTVGAKLETTDKNRTVLNIVFDNIQTILNNCKLSSRIRFMLMDLQDLRTAKWVSNKSEAGPKTIQEIHNEAEMKRLEDEKSQAERRRKNNRTADSRSNSSRAGSSWGSNSQSKRNDPRTQTKTDSFTPVPSRSQSNKPINASDSSFQRENSKRSESIQSNMFAALGDGGEEEENNDDHEAVNTEVPEATEEAKEIAAETPAEDAQ